MKKNNRLLIYVNASLSWGGLEINTVRLAKWLSREMNVLLLCQKNSPIAENALKEGISIDYIEKKRKYFPLKASWKLYNYIKKKKSNQILFSDNNDMSYCCWAKIYSGNKFQIYYQQQMQLGLNKKGMIHTSRYKLLNAWISPLPWLVEEVKQRTNINPDKMHCIPLGLDTKALLEQSMEQSKAREFFQMKITLPIVGIMGRLEKKKNQHLLIQAAKILKGRGIDIAVLIVGDPTKGEVASIKYAEELREMAKENKMEEQVYFHSFTNNIAAFYNAIDIFVMATDRETYGMVTLESMLFGTPVISSNTGGSPEILEKGKYGTLFESGDERDLADKITFVLEHSEEIEKQTALARQRVIEHFDYRIECEEIINLLNN